MAYTIKLFVVLVIAGGAIAWLGDVIGARLGKQRRTLFGLRPRQSARLIAVIVGALLPLGGLLVATVGSEYARKAVFEMDDLLANIKDLRVQVEDFRQQVAEARQTAAQARESARHSAEQLQKARERVDSLTDVQASLEGQVGDLESQAAHLQSEVSRGREEVTQAREQLERSRTSLERLKEELDSVESRKDLAENHLRSIQNAIDAAHRAVEGAEQELALREQRLAHMQDALAEVQRQLDQLKERDRLITGQRALFELGDELIRWVLDADETQDQMESALFELLHLASRVAERRGVPVGPNGRAVVAVAPAPVQVAPGERPPEALVVRHVASLLRTGGADQWVVVLRTFRRIFPGDNTQLEVQFRAQPNVKVFDKDEVLAEIPVRADADTAVLFKTIYMIITDRETSPVRAQAIARGMLPDPKTGNYGRLDLDDIFQAIDEVKALGGAAVVKVVARRDIYTVGPLDIYLRVAKRDESSP
ncbi:MAG: DUF3084 domain-containing protein [Armatimonadetes bacterium]|nr:DUF3084 domain-containing protein [Armatimonadota bacterium]